MTIPLSKFMGRTFTSPIVEAQNWTKGIIHPTGRPLLNVSQAAPMAPPPLALREEIARIAVEDDGAHLYGPVLGLPDLRREVAAQWSQFYRGSITPEDVAITSGCNQAFTAIMSTICAAGDEVILPTPWYFNHKMWADMNGVNAVPLAAGPDLVPDLEVAARLITPRTRAIVLVTPNNPCGVEYPSDLLTKFYALAQQHQIALVLDETYREFDSRTDVPHPLFAQLNWRETLVHLYSFSKSYRLTGHRVGAVIADPKRLLEVEKYLDTVSICPNQIAQRAALWGLRNLGHWVQKQRQDILVRRAAIENGFKTLENKGWRLKGCGAFFAYVEHPFDMPSSQLAPWLVENASILLLPGTSFVPKGDPNGERHLRIAFANVDLAGISTLFERLAQIDP